MVSRSIGLRLSVEDFDKVCKHVDAGAAITVSDFVRQATREKIARYESLD